MIDKKATKSRHILFPLFIVICIICLVVTIISIVYVFISLSKLEIKRNGQKVSAQIIDISVSTGGILEGYYYDLDYYYIDESGIEYYGHSTMTIKGEDVALAYIGSSIEIYIDGKGGSVDADAFNNNSPLIAGAFSIIFLGATIITFYYGILPHKIKSVKKLEKLEKATVLF